MVPSRAMRAASFALGVLLILLFAGPLVSFEAAVPPPRSARAQEPPPADPTQAGPYAVGVTRRAFTRASSTSGQPRTLDTVIWYPADGSSLLPDPTLEGTVDAPPKWTDGPYPLLLWSHGSGGVPWEATYFTAHLASHGFVVVAPTHVGNSTDCPFPCLPTNPRARSSIIEAELQRPDDIIFALDEAVTLSVGADPLLAGLIDPERAGVAGLSFGAGTAVRVIGRDRRFRAAVALAPYASSSTRQAVATIDGPTMLWGGHLDQVLPFPQQQALYDAFPPSGPERWLLAFPRAGHFAFGNYCPAVLVTCGSNNLPQARAHLLIRRWSTPFLRRHVALDARYVELANPAFAEADPDLRISFGPGS